MIFQVVVKCKAQKFLETAPLQDCRRVKAVLFALKENPAPHGCKKLKGRNAYRIRCGDYRVIYQIRRETATVAVIAIGHRKEVYRG